MIKIIFYLSIIILNTGCFLHASISSESLNQVAPTTVAPSFSLKFTNSVVNGFSNIKDIAAEFQSEITISEYSIKSSLEECANSSVWSPSLDKSIDFIIDLSQQLNKVYIKVRWVTGQISDCKEYTIKPDLTPPSKPEKFLAELVLSPRTVSESILFDWISSTDTGSGVSHYEVQIIDIYSKQIIIDWQPHLPGTRITGINVVDPSIVLLAKIRAVDLLGNKSDILWSDLWSGQMTAKNLNPDDSINYYSISNIATILDFNGDGYLDLYPITLGNSLGTKQLYLGSSSGSFSKTTQFPTYTDCKERIFGDFNGDGKIDCFSLDHLYIAEDGVIPQKIKQELTLISSISIFDLYKTADFDKDGDLDVLYYKSNQFFLIRNDNLIFKDFLIFTTAMAINDFLIADIDGDEKFDIVASSITADVIGYYKNAAGYPYTQISNLQVNPSGLAIADFDGDGDLDLISGSNNTGGTSILYLNDGLGQFTSQGSITNVNYVFKVIDWDKDGDSDIVSSNNSNVYLVLNNGSGVFTTSMTLYNSFESYIAIYDYDSDGDFDLIKNEGIRVNNGSNDFNTFITWHNFFDNQLLLDGIINLEIADLDGNSHMDLIYSTGSGVIVRFNEGGLQFSVKKISSTITRSFFMKINDLDNDGDRDIVLLDNNTNQIILIENKGARVFAEVTLLSNVRNLNGASFAIADVNLDGRLDIVHALNSANTIVLQIQNAGVGLSFNQTTIDTNVITPTSIVAGNFNSNDHLDLAVSTNNTSGNSYLFLYANDGSDNFNKVTVQNGGNFGFFNLFSHDFDSDGDLDLIALQEFVYVYLLANNGNGVFAAPVLIGTGSWCRQIAIGDINKDGFNDLVMFDEEANNLTDLLYYKSNNSSSLTRTVLTKSAPWNINSIKLGDVNGDGNLDIIVNSNAYNNSVPYFNHLLLIQPK